MYTIYDASPLTVLIIISTVVFTPFYMLILYTQVRKGIILSGILTLLAGIASLICLYELLPKLGEAGAAAIPILWLVPSFIVWLQRDWFMSDLPSQKLLVGLQIFRVIGGTFLIEMARGNVPGIFAYPAGIGDIFVGLLAAAVLIIYRNKPLPRAAVLAVLIAGLTDFFFAGLFGVTSNTGPLQQFAHGFDNKLLQFPTGMIPLYLVPYALVFHMLSWLRLQQDKPNGKR